MRQRAHRVLRLWLVLPMSGVLLGGVMVPPAQAQEMTGGMKLILEELRDVKHSYAEALVQIEALRQQVQALAAGGLAAVSYRLPPKVDFAGQPVPLERRDVWERLDQEFLLYIGQPGQVMLWLKRTGKYLPLIAQQLKAYGLPEDLKYLPVVESSLRPTAVSAAGAGGLWQFIEGTGRRYDMEHTPFIDERMDVSKATDGALQYLQHLYGIFQDWPLALAGYNVGEQRVLHELQDQGVSSYYDLVLPAETERFVYKIIAMKIILSNAKRYGIVVNERDYYQLAESEPVTVRISGNHLHLRTVAEAAGTTFAMIKQLNPQLRQRYLPRGVYQIYVPKGAAATFAEHFQEPFTAEPVAENDVPSQAVSYKPPPRRAATPSRKTIHYAVKRGDTLSKIATKFDASVHELMKWNKLAHASQLTAGRQLIIFKE